MELKQHFNYYKDLKLGVFKAIRFLNLLDKELKPMAVHFESDFFYINVITGVKYFFDDSENSRKRVDFFLQKLMLNFFVLESDMLYLDDYNINHARLKYVIKNCDLYSLNKVINIKPEFVEKKEIILHKLLLLSLNSMEKFDYNVLLDIFDYNIIYFFLINDINYEKRIYFMEKISLDNFDNKKDLIKECFDLNIDDVELQECLIENIVMWYKNENNIEINPKKKYLSKLVLNDFFNFDKKLGITQDGFHDSVVKIIESKDDMLDLKLPKIYKKGPKYKLIKISYENFILYFLDPLNSCRIFYKINYLDRMYKLGLKRFVNLCKRYKANDNLSKFNQFAFDFLGKKRMENFNINDKLIKYIFQIEDLLNLVFYKRILLNEKVFRNMVMGSFSNFYYYESTFFDKKDKWMVK